ncbi:MAG: hypothetical protein ACREXP_10090 [Steroidobacteraceae bacterium]
MTLRSPSRLAPMGMKAWFAAAILCSALVGCAKSDPALPEVIVYKSASCGCCKVWARHLRDAGFRVTVRNADDLSPVKQRLGIPAAMRSCHTAEVQ